jgi:hypothetical protein
VRERTPNYHCMTLYVYQLRRKLGEGWDGVVMSESRSIVSLEVKENENKFNFLPGFPYIWEGFDSHESTDTLPFLQNSQIYTKIIG